uniref:Uncharacterized protein n=1 Tax=Fundulus heteroclitus TaxID=8078 RepID=A0A3Q2PB29_FUNHE
LKQTSVKHRSGSVIVGRLFAAAGPSWLTFIKSTMIFTVYQRIFSLVFYIIFHNKFLLCYFCLSVSLTCVL